MIIDAGSFQVAVDVDIQGAMFEAIGCASGDVPTVGGAVETARRAVIEVKRLVGGLPQHALLGGTMDRPTSLGRLIVEVALSGVTSTTPLSCRTLLGRELIPGLPDEFGGAVVSGILGSATRCGVLSIDRGAYHPVESSRVAFSLAGSLLAVVLESDHGNVEARVRATLATLV